VSGGPTASLPTSAEELHALVVELVEANAGLREVIAAQDHQIASLEQRIAELERQLGADSSTSSWPPSSGPLYRKPARRSSRTSSGRRPGKQPGAPGSAMPLVEDPDEIVACDPGCCGHCGEDLSGAPVVGVARRQVVDLPPPPAPRVTEYQIITRACPACGNRSAGTAPGCAPARVQYGPRVLARAAELVCAHYLPVARAARMMRSMLGVGVSTGFVATVRHRAAQLAGAHVFAPGAAAAAFGRGTPRR
jgi:transposase